VPFHLALDQSNVFALAHICFSYLRLVAFVAPHHRRLLADSVEKVGHGFHGKKVRV
jgi:hypothetical protein